jgi:hypothetical protein
MDVIAILRKKRQEVTDYRMQVATQRADHPQVYTPIVSGPTVDPAAVARAVELPVTKYCSVHAMLSAACPITHEFRIVLAGRRCNQAAIKRAAPIRGLDDTRLLDRYWLRPQAGQGR